MRLLKPSTSAASLVATSLIVLGMGGCSGDKVATYEPVTDPAQLYTSLELNHGAITMATTAPYNTLQLVATPRDARGEPMEELPPPTFTSLDTTSVFVSPEGLLTARQPASNVVVIAELTSGGVRHVDTALVNVTDQPPVSPLETFAIHIAESDSTMWSVFPPEPDSLTIISFYAFAFSPFTPQTPLDLRPRILALDAVGNPIPEPLVKYRSLDPDVVHGIGGELGSWSGQAAQPQRSGKVRIVAQTTMYGVAKADTVTFTVTPPVVAYVAIDPNAPSVFGPTQRIRTNGFVLWTNALDRPVQLVYDNPANVLPAPTDLCNSVLFVLQLLTGGPSSDPHHCDGGNITIPAPDAANIRPIGRTIRAQQFSVPGTYTYHDAQTGASGRIIVTDGMGEP